MTNAKTEAAVIDRLGNVLGLVSTAQRAGPCRYYYMGTLDGTPVNSQVGKLSRSMRNLRAAWREGEFGTQLCRGVNDCAPE